VGIASGFKAIRRATGFPIRPMLQREKPKTEGRLSVAFEGSCDSGQISGQIGDDGGWTPLEDGVGLEHVERHLTGPKTRDFESLIEDTITTPDEKSIAPLREQNPNQAFARGSRLVHETRHRDLGFFGRTVTPNDLQIHRTRRGMDIEFETNRTPMTNSDDLVLTNFSEDLVGLGIDEQTVYGNMIATRKEALKARFSRNHVVFSAYRNVTLAQILFRRSARRGAVTTAQTDAKDAAQLIGILDRHGDIAPLTK